MPEKLPSEANEFEERVVAEMSRLREKREQLLHSPLTGDAFILPPSTEKGLRELAEDNIRSQIKKEEERQEREKIKKYVKAEGLTEEELEVVARMRAERQRNK